MRIAIAEFAAVLDAGVIYEYLAPGNAFDEVAPLFDPSARFECWVPDHCLVEVGNALRKRYLRDVHFTRARLRRAIENLLELGPLAIPLQALLQDAMAFVDILTPYDAAYLVLAQLLGLTLVTLDPGIAQAAEKQRVRVLVPKHEAVETWIASAQS